MLANMVDDRLGVKAAEAKRAILGRHPFAPLEYDELMLERRRQGRARPAGRRFRALAWIDEDGRLPQYARLSSD
jgi:hypothetical protein